LKVIESYVHFEVPTLKAYKFTVYEILRDFSYIAGPHSTDLHIESINSTITYQRCQLCPSQESMKTSALIAFL